MTGPEFAEAHGNDSTDWMPADFESAEHFAEIDLQPVYALLQKKKQPTTDLTPAA